MVLVPVLWSLAGMVIRHLHRVNTPEIIFWRSLSASVFVCLVLLVARKKRFLASWRHAGYLGVLSAVFWGVTFTCFLLSLTLTTVANTLVVDSITPLVTALLAWLMLRQKPPVRTWVAALFTFGGVAWMFADNLSGLGGTHLTGMLLALVLPFAYAFNFIILNAAGQKTDMLPGICLGGLLSALVVLPFAHPFKAGLSDVGVMVGLGVFQLGLPCVLLVYAARFLPPAEIALLVLLETLLGPLWVWIGIDEIPSNSTLMGGIVVMLSLLLHEIGAIRPDRPRGASRKH